MSQMITTAIISGKRVFHRIRRTQIFKSFGINITKRGWEKTGIFLIAFLLLPLACRAETSDSARHRIGPFGGIGLNYSELSGKETLEIIVHGGVIYNYWLTGGIHFDAFFMFNPIKDPLNQRDANLLGVYGGLFVTPIIRPNSVVHADIPVFIGYGTVSYELLDIDRITTKIEDSDRFWVFEPGVEVELNVLKFVRVAIGGYYRFTTKVKLMYENNEPILDDRFLNGFSVGLRLRIGIF